MGSGNKVKIEVQSRGSISLDSYADAHRDLDCKGHFKLIIVPKAIVPVGALGPLRVPAAIMAHCGACGAGFIVPQFRVTLETAITTQLVLSRELLSKPQIRFLRQYFALTQEELALKIGIADRHTFSKLESEGSPRAMAPETQVIMKFVFANMLGIKDAERLYPIVEDLDDSRETQINSADLPSESDVKKMLKAG